MSRSLVAVGLVLWLGTTLLLSCTRRGSRAPLATRLAPYRTGPGRPGSIDRRPPPTLRALLVPTARRAGDRLARAVGVHEDLTLRLTRIHSSTDAGAFRTRQVGWAVVAGAAAAATTVASGAPGPIGLAAILGAPVLAFLVLEHGAARASARWQRALALEMPVVCEQLGLLLGAGSSLSGALARVARRGRGACARDLDRVGARIRHGLDEAEALAEWAGVAQVDAVDRVVHLLALEHEATDLSRLLGDEARALRADLHRARVALLQRRAQQVWIPVTVAALVPGVLLLAVPFAHALSLYAGS